MDSTGTYALVANIGGNSVTPLTRSGTTWTASTAIAVGSGPRGVSMASPTSTSTSTYTATSTDTQTGTSTHTATDTYTATSTQTATGSQTGTHTETSTALNTYTQSYTYSQTSTSLSTWTYLQTSTAQTTSTGTQTSTGTVPGTRTLTSTVTTTQTATAMGVANNPEIVAPGLVQKTQPMTFGGGLVGTVLTGTGTNTSTWTATATTTNTALGSLTGISSTVTNTATNTLTGTGSADSVAVFNWLLGLRTGSIKDNPSTGVDVEAAVAIGEGTDAWPTAGKRLVLVYASDDTAKIIAEDFGTSTLKVLQLFSASGLYLQGGIGSLRITDTYSEFNQPISAPNLTLAGHGIADLWKPTSVCATGQVMTYLTDNSVPTCVTNGTGSGIGCSGGACTYGNWARFTDTTHIEGVAAPTWSSVGADQAGAAAAVQGLLGIQLVDVQSAMRGTSYTSSASYEYSTISSVGFTALGGQRIIVHGVASAATYTTNGACTLAIFLGSSQIGPTINSNTNNHRTTLSTVVNYPGLSAGSYTVYLKMSTGEEGSTCAIDANASYLMVERYTN
jgi:hypothetical protein